MMKKRLLAVMTAAGLAASMLAGCGSSSSSSSETSSEDSSTEEATEEATDEATEEASASTDEEELNIQVVVNTLSSEYWGYVKAGAEAYEVDHPNVHVTVQGPTSETDYEGQQSMVETIIASGDCDGLVVSALQQETICKLVESCDIPVVAVNTDLESERKSSFVGTGNEAAAEEGGKAAVEAAKAAGWEELNCIFISGVQGDPTHAARMAGFKTGSEEAGGTFLEDEVQYADSVADKAVTAMEAIIQNHPEGVACILSSNDDMAIAAAKTAASSAAADAYKNTIFCGFDGIQSACESILSEGGETMSVAQDPYGMGYKSVETIVAVINGETVDEFVDTGCSIITKDNAQEQLDTLKTYLGE